MDIFDDIFKISKAFHISKSQRVLSSYIDQYVKWEYLYKNNVNQQFINICKRHKYISYRSISIRESDFFLLTMCTALKYFHFKFTAGGFPVTSSSLWWSSFDHRPYWPLMPMSPCTLTQGQWDTPVTSTHLSFGRDECDVKVNYDTHSPHACITVTSRLYEDERNIQKSSTS